MDLLKTMEQLLSKFYIPKVGIMDVVEIFLIVLTLYQFLKSVRNTRTMILIKAVSILFIFYVFAEIASFDVIVVIFQSLALIAVVAVIVIFQPELRRILEKLGTAEYIPIQTLIKQRKNTKGIKRYSDESIQEMVEAAFALSKTKTGALIVLEKDIPLHEYITTGIDLNANISSALFINIFEKNTPLHDGAVIIHGDKVIAATCYLPLSDNPNIGKHLGTRHRAAIGISEATDSIVIVVSEETGKVSYIENGMMIVCKHKEDLIEKLKSHQIKAQLAKKEINIKNNLTLKIASLISGIMIWFFIINAIDPITTKTIYDVPITVINETALTDVDKSYKITSKQTVNVEVTDIRSVIESLTIQDITITADMKKLSYVYSVPLSAKAKTKTTKVSIIDENTMTVELDNIVAKEFPLTFTKVGKANSNYFVSKIYSATDGIIVTGPEKMINTIDKVEFVVDVSEAKENFTKTVKPTIYDKNGNVINDSEYTLNKNQITVTAELLKTKKIPINITLAKEKDEKYKLSIVEYSPISVRVAAVDDILSELKELNIEVKSEINSIEMRSSTFTKEINIEDYLPEGVYCADKTNKINITMEYKPFITKTLEFTNADILIEGLNSNYELFFNSSDKFSVDIIGLEEALQDITNVNITPYIDVSDLNVGSYALKLLYKAPENLRIKSDINVEFEIVKKIAES